MLLSKKTDEVKGLISTESVVSNNSVVGENLVVEIFVVIGIVLLSEILVVTGRVVNLRAGPDCSARPAKILGHNAPAQLKS